VLIGLLLVAATPSPAAEGDPSKAGAYCPLPAPGQKPACLAPAQAQYSEFFAAIEGGRVSDADFALVEADLQSEERAYMALSSVAYAYLRLAELAGRDGEGSSEVDARLVRWNELLSSLYAESESDPRFRKAVRTAAEELDQRVPSTDVLSMVESMDEGASVRGPIVRLIQRALGDSE
jgi:hypothetical protein